MSTIALAELEKLMNAALAHAGATPAMAAATARALAAAEADRGGGKRCWVVGH